MKSRTVVLKSSEHDTMYTTHKTGEDRQKRSHDHQTDRQATEARHYNVTDGVCLDQFVSVKARVQATGVASLHSAPRDLQQPSQG